jgi:hypothetical protein
LGKERKKTLLAFSPFVQICVYPFNPHVLPRKRKSMSKANEKKNQFLLV